MHKNIETNKVFVRIMDYKGKWEGGKRESEETLVVALFYYRLLLELHRRAKYKLR